MAEVASTPWHQFKGVIKGVRRINVPDKSDMNQKRGSPPVPAPPFKLCYYSHSITTPENIMKKILPCTIQHTLADIEKQLKDFVGDKTNIQKKKSHSIKKHFIVIDFSGSKITISKKTNIKECQKNQVQIKVFSEYSLIAVNPVSFHGGLIKIIASINSEFQK